MKTRDTATCFLFAKHLDADGCLSVRFNAAGEEDAVLKKRNASEILALQEQAKTVVVLPGTSASLHRLTLPWLHARKAREAIPFALEELIAQPVFEVHFAFDRSHYADGQYLIVAIENQHLSTCIGLLDELNIDFDALTLDWFALNAQEVLVAQDYVLISTQHFKGTLSPVLAQHYLMETTETFHGFVFDDSAITVRSAQLTSMQENFECFVAKRLLSHPFINLCQGDFKHHTHHEAHTRWYYACGFLFAGWLLSIFGTNALLIHQLKKQDQEVQQQITTIYRAFFPNASGDEVNPRLRVEEALREEENGQKGDLWYILGPLVKAVDDMDGIEVTQWSYQNKVITVHLIAKNFMALEGLEKRLEKMKIRPKQSHAETAEKGKVTAVLELQA